MGRFTVHMPDDYNPSSATPGVVVFTQFPSPRSELLFPDSPDGSPADLVFGLRTELLAPDYKTAVAYAKERGIDEEVVSAGSERPPYMLPSEWYDAGNIPQALHAACFMGFVALKAGVATPEDLLSDGGIIHNLAHMLLKPSNFGPEADDPKSALHRVRGAMLEGLRRLEARTPGYTRPTPWDWRAAYPEAKDA